VSLPPLRIGFLDSWLQDSAGGSGTAVAIGGLAAALQARGHRVERIVPRGHWPRSLLLRRLVFNLTLPVRLREGQGPPPYDLLVGFDIDGVRLAHRSPVPYVCSIKGVLAEEARCERGWPALMLRSLSLLECLHARRAPLVLSTSAYCCERIQALYGVASERLVVVSEGIDPAAWCAGDGATGIAPVGGGDPDPEPAESREPFLVLCVARQYPRKRVGDLIAAFPRVLQGCPQARLVVIGDGPEHLALQRQVAALGLDSAVRLLGALPSDQEVRGWYRRASIFCLPSIQEGFGIVFLEAMASGLAVVSTTATAIPEVVPHQRAGLLVPPRDPEALAAALLRLLTDPEQRQRLADGGRAHARSFSWDRVAEDFLQAVAPLLRGSPSG
jgi:glycosyltransferase involved in cell wall biosynthesis